MNPSAVFEVSWEVCNKVGGIYQVVKSKAELLTKHYDTYIVIGPYFQQQAQYEFAQAATPQEFKQAFDELQSEGIQCLYGKWQVKGEPAAILINCKEAKIDQDGVKRELWERYQVDSLMSGGDYTEPLVFSWAAGKLIDKLQHSVKGPTVAQCHEWLTGFTLLYLRAHAPAISTVFTTHATTLGRSMCGSGQDLYGSFGTFDPQKKAAELNVTPKHSVERASAHNAHVFTTVSQITALEAEHLLGKRPDILTLNGLDDSKFPTFEEASILHQKNREKIRDFLEFYFFSHYTFDMDQTIILFITGRNEFRNKGLDVFIKALGRLNQKLRDEKINKTVVAFFWIPNEVHGIKTELLEEKGVFNHLKQYVQENTDTFTRRLLRNLPNIKEYSCVDLLTEEFVHSIQRQMQALHHEGNPPLVTHNIPDEGNDPMVRAFRDSGLHNSQQDPVKVIAYPVYLTGSDGLLDLQYNDAVSGCHLGVFPSYYEPWGYTPVEAMAFGVPAITTDLAGFGAFIEPYAGKGIYVLKRQQRTEDDVVQELFEILLNFAHKDKFQRNEEKTQAKTLTKRTDWATFISYYYQAYAKAVERTHGN